jgi:hypothetical protein
VAESGLSLARNDLRNAVGFYAGFGLDYAQYSTDQLAITDKIIDIGCRKFYQPPPIPGERTTHVWSFLQPIARMSLTEDVVDYDLPDDYAGLQDMIYLSTDDTTWTAIEQTHASRILSKRQGGLELVNGRPELVAVQVIPSTGETPTRRSLMVWPTPDQAYTINFVYTSNPFQLTATQLYPLGGQPHAETLRMACLAAAEQNLNDERNLQYTEFMERLTASVHFDRQANGPKSYGYNGDRSTSPVGRDYRNNNTVTYMGTVYDGTQ